MAKIKFFTFPFFISTSSFGLGALDRDVLCTSIEDVHSTKFHQQTTFSSNMIGSKLFAVSKDGQWLFAGGHWDNRLAVYNLNHGRLKVLVTSPHTDTISCLAVNSTSRAKSTSGMSSSAPDGSEAARYLITGSKDGTCAVWDFDLESAIQLEEQEARRNQRRESDEYETISRNSVHKDNFTSDLNSMLTMDPESRLFLHDLLHLDSIDDALDSTVRDNSDRELKKNYELLSEDVLHEKRNFQQLKARRIPQFGASSIYRHAGTPFYPPGVINIFGSNRNRQWAKVIRLFHTNSCCGAVACCALDMNLDIALVATRQGNTVHLYSVLRSCWSKVLNLDESVPMNLHLLPAHLKLHANGSALCRVEHIIVSTVNGSIYVQWNLLRALTTSSTTGEIGPWLNLYNANGELLARQSILEKCDDFAQLPAHLHSRLTVTKVILTSNLASAKIDREQLMASDLDHHLLIATNMGHFVVIRAGDLVPLKTLSLGCPILDMGFSSTLTGTGHLFNGLHIFFALSDGKLLVCQPGKTDNFSRHSSVVSEPTDQK